MVRYWLGFKYRFVRDGENFLVDIPIEVLKEHTEWLPGMCVTEAFSTTCAAYIEDCERRL